MRRFLLCIQFLLLIFISISQNPTNKIYTVKKQKIGSIKSLNEIIPDFPKNITWFSMELMVNVGGKHGTKYFKGTNPNTIKFSFLSQAKANSFVFLTLKCKVESGEVVYKKYRIKVVE